MHGRASRIASPGRGRGAAAALAVLALVMCAATAWALTFPQLTGRVIDEAGIIDAATRSTLEQKLADFEIKTTGQIVVVTLKSLQGTSIEDYGYQLGRYWKIGQKDTNNGAVLIVAPNERNVRIEVGYGLEGQLTDAVSKLIIENSIIPRFKANDYPGGIMRGVDDIIQAVSVDPEEWKSRARKRPDTQPPAIDFFTLIIFLFIFWIVFRAIVRSSKPQLNRRKDGGWVLAPSGGSWSSGSDSSWSGGGGGGGFSGGGGSFGGGGASGSW